MPALVDFMAGLIMREGTTFLIRIATSWPMPTFRPEAVADIHSPTGTKLKNTARNTIISTMMKIGAKNSIGFSPFFKKFYLAIIL